MTILTKRLLQETFNPIAIDGTAYSYVQIGDLGILTEDLHESIGYYTVKNGRYYYSPSILNYDFSNIGLEGWHLPTTEECTKIFRLISNISLCMNQPREKIWRNSYWKSNGGNNILNLNFGAYGYLVNNNVINDNETCSYYTNESLVALDSFYTTTNFYTYRYPLYDFDNAKRSIRLVKRMPWNTETKLLQFRNNALKK